MGNHIAEGCSDALQGSTAQAAQYRSKLGGSVAGRATALLMLSVKMLSGESYLPATLPDCLQQDGALICCAVFDCTSLHWDQ